MNTSDAVPQPPSRDSSLTTRSSDSDALASVGQVANERAARNAVTDYLARKADNTIRRQAADLQRFADFLDAVGTGSGLALGAALTAFARAVGAFPDGQPPDPEAWRGVT